MRLYLFTIPESTLSGSASAWYIRKQCNSYSYSLKLRIHVFSFPLQISKLREEIQKFQASEAEIKALSFNYAAMLKEKEEQLGRLREENGSLKRNLESCKAVSANSNVIQCFIHFYTVTIYHPLWYMPLWCILQISQGTLERSPRAQRNAVQENSLDVTKQNGYGGGSSHGIQPNGLHSVTGNHKVVITYTQLHCT